MTAKTEPEDMLAAVDPHREKFGLKPFKVLRGEGGEEKETLLIQQKTETVDALSKIAQPCPGVPEVRRSVSDHCTSHVRWMCFLNETSDGVGIVLKLLLSPHPKRGSHTELGHMGIARVVFWLPRCCMQ